MSFSGRKWDEDELILPGFRFHPTDEELVDFYLRRKVANKQLSIELIKQIDIYKYEPWELPTISAGADDQEWYFFCLRGRKYKNSVRPNRVTSSGFWKATGIDKPIYSLKVPHDCIGLKKSLVYYRGTAGKGSKTDWMMHEFRLPPQPRHSTSPHMHINLATPNNNTLEAEVWTLCRIFKRNTSQRKYIPAQPQPQPDPLPQLKFSLSSTLADSNSKTCSNESNSNHNNKDNNNKSDQFYLGFTDQTSIGQQKLYTTQFELSSPSPLALVSNSSSFDPFWNGRGDLMFSAGDQDEECGDWDELRMVVDPY